MACACCNPVCDCDNAVLQTNVSSISWTAPFSTETKSGTTNIVLGTQTRQDGTIGNTPNLFEYRETITLPLGTTYDTALGTTDLRLGYIFLSFRRCQLDFFFGWSEYIFITNPGPIPPGWGGGGRCGAAFAVIGGRRTGFEFVDGMCQAQMPTSRNIYMRGFGGRGAALFSPDANATWLEISDPFCLSIEPTNPTVAVSGTSITFNFNPLP